MKLGVAAAWLAAGAVCFAQTPQAPPERPRAGKVEIMRAAIRVSPILRMWARVMSRWA
jgi:hypothetical protein